LKTERSETMLTRVSLWKIYFFLPALPVFGAVEFNRDIRPILSDKCFPCHGPDSNNRFTKLRFDTEAGAKQALAGGRLAIVPGDPTHSEMLHRITAPEATKRMPPVNSGYKLTDAEISQIRRWIEEGARWQQHWAWIAPQRPDLPAVRDAKWVRNPIDSFVLERLEREGIRPSLEAERERLIRRVSLDLTGLPPSPAEVDAFITETSPDAYEKVVDRLLASPRYGERMAERWLDAARYADSHGYQTDGERQMWRWRDWVIDAFNQNMRFDRFTIEQLAGDLLPNATLEQRIATGFNRNHRANAEGGIVPEEYQVEYVVDRVSTTATVWLGITLGCARCHDHKYDPFSQKDFYRVFAYFNNVAEKGRIRKVGNTEPMIPAPTREQQPALREAERKLKAAQAKFAAFEPDLAAAQRVWERSLERSQPLDWSIARGLIAHHVLADANSTDAKLGSVSWSDGSPAFSVGRVGPAALFDGKTFVDAGDTADFSQDSKFTLAAWIYPVAASGAIVTHTPDLSELEGAGEYLKGYGFYLKAGKLQFNLTSRWNDNALSAESEKKIELNRWTHVLVTYDGSRTADGVHLYIDGKSDKVNVLLDDLTSATKAKEPLRIGAGAGRANRFQGRMQDVRIYNVALSGEQAAVVATPESIREIAALPSARRNPGQTDKIRLYFLENYAPAPIANAWNDLLATRDDYDKFVATLPTVMVMQELPTQRETHVLLRGAYDKPGDKVTAGTPSILPPLPAGAPKNRVGFAQWVVDPANPLTARVIVNRLWEMYFGTGLVKTVDDFGSQGEWPSHPALLDWLATEFVRTGWDMKAMHRLIVTSATYRQSSKVTPEMQQSDPENRLLARGPRFRMAAEMIRDQALYAAGLMVEKIGGPSVKPYQPTGLWKELLSSDYPQDHGESLYRRSLYTFWRRTAPPPSMMNFDAAGRETCTVNRSRTNTPLQALDLMNDVAYLEAARVLAARALKEAGRNQADRVGLIFRLVTARYPSADETEVLLSSLRYYLDMYLTDRQAAIRYLNQGEHTRDESLEPAELAAYTVLASLILNLDETITKGN
jgi:hypothetical protein